MANLKRLNKTCPRRCQVFPVQMYFLRFAGPYRPVYRCPVCQSTVTYYRAFHGGPIVRVR